MDEILFAFGEHLKELRKSKNMTQLELSFAANLHRNYISDVERGERNVSLKALEKLALGLKVSLMDLMNF